MCQNCIKNKECTCACKGKDVQVSQQKNGIFTDNEGKISGGGSSTVAICTNCKHRIHIDEGKSGCCGAMILGPIGLLFNWNNEDEREK